MALAGGFPIKKIVVSLVILLVGVWGVWFIAIPESFLVGRIRGFLEDRKIPLELTGLKKGFFYSLHIEQVIVRAGPERGIPGSGGEQRGQTSPSPTADDHGDVALLRVQNLDITPDLSSLLQLQPRLHFGGRTGEGRIQGVVTLQRQNVTATMEGNDIALGDLLFFARMGIYGEGTLGFNLQWQGRGGTITVSIRDAKLTGSFAGITAVPLNYVKNVRGMITLGETITVNPLTLEGPGVYVRMKGDIRGGNFEGRAEIMVDASFDLSGLLQVLLKRYQVSPGYYVVPYSANVAGNPSSLP